MWTTSTPTAAGITDRGAELVHGPADFTDRMRVAHLRDPEGNPVESQEWPLMRG